MGLFDIFKRSRQEETQDHSVATDPYFLEALKTRIMALGYLVYKLPGKNALMLNGEIEVTPVIYTPASTHWTLLHVRTVVTHPQYFPAGITENIDGYGTTLDKRVYSAIDAYLESFLIPVIECVSGRHNPRFDIFTPTGQQILCHSNPAPVIWHGRWTTYPEGEPVFDLLQDALRTRLISAGIFSWLRVSASNMGDPIGGGCTINEEHWQEGLDIVKKYAADWATSPDILGVQQFIVFRKCDG